MKLTLILYFNTLKIQVRLISRNVAIEDSLVLDGYIKIWVAE